ncbi:MAG: methyl-accepting chemotaxis protein [Deltaproteobacteria bacterium]|nr:methyl-accepting chemotaxis protein [Deltaproteobacteria bacterium]
MLRHGLKAKILSLTIGLSILGFGLLIYLVIKESESSLLRERVKTSELMAQPILHAIYKDMLEERADMARFLIAGLKTIKGVERVQIIRSNGVEEAFQDFKTLKAVKIEFGEIKPEWTAEHPDKPNNVAAGIDNAEFKKALIRFNKGSRDAIYYTDREGGKSLFTYLVPVSARPKCSSCHGREEAARGVLMISTSLDEMYSILSAGRDKWIAHGFVTIAATALLLGLLVAAVVTRPIDRAVGMLRNIAEGKGDLTKRLDIGSSDEIGLLGRWFNKFVSEMQRMVKDIFGVSRDVTASSQEIESSSREIAEGVNKQLMAVEETSSSIKELDSSIRTVAEGADALNSFSGEAASSARATATAVDTVKTNIENLSYSASSIASSISGIAVSINRAAAHIDELFKKTGDVVSSITGIGVKVKEIEEYSKAQAALSEKVRTDAEEMGLTSVVKTREGIEKVSAEVSSTASVINSLGQRSKEIGGIITVINEIADTTHLLALNATILATQAGEHGKGFAVVARQIKDLATKTTVSTKEIAGIIKQIQGEASVSVESMQRSSEKVADGVKLSRNSEDALLNILESTRKSFEMAKLIEKDAQEQTAGVEQISNATRVINEMVAGIKKAAREESVAAKDILMDTAEMKEFMEKARLSTLEQTRETKHVFDAIVHVAAKASRVAEATYEQLMLSEKILAAIETVRQAALDNSGLASRLEKTVMELNRQAEALRGTVANFKT